MEAQIEGQMNAIRGNEDSRKYDLQFHRIMGECAKNLPLSILMNSLTDLMIEALSGIEVSREMRSHGVQFHRLVLDAIRRTTKIRRSNSCSSTSAKLKSG